MFSPEEDREARELLDLGMAAFTGYDPEGQYGWMGPWGKSPLINLGVPTFSANIQIEAGMVLPEIPNQFGSPSGMLLYQQSSSLEDMESLQNTDFDQPEFPIIPEPEGPFPFPWPPSPSSIPTEVIPWGMKKKHKKSPLHPAGWRILLPFSKIPIMQVNHQLIEVERELRGMEGDPSSSAKRILDLQRIRISLLSLKTDYTKRLAFYWFITFITEIPEGLIIWKRYIIQRQMYYTSKDKADKARKEGNESWARDLESKAKSHAEEAEKEMNALEGLFEDLWNSGRIKKAINWDRFIEFLDDILECRLSGSPIECFP